MENYSIRKIIEKINLGEIRIPAFQREFVWDAEKIAFLMDSLYKGFPIGSVLFWRTREQLKTERNLGDFTLPEPQKDYPIDYVLDGQQRSTSIFTVFQTDLEKNNTIDWLDIYYIIGSEQDVSIQQSNFIALSPEGVDLNKHFPLNVLFDPKLYREATSNLNDDVIEEIDKLQTRFKELSIPVESIETENKEHVAIVFERINTAGQPLDTFQLLTAWSWSTEFDLQEEISELSEELSEYGFSELTNNQDLLLKCCAGCIVGETTPKAILSLDGSVVRNDFQSIKSGILSSIDFLKKELYIHNYKLIPYPSMLVPLTKFFATSKTNGFLYTDKQRKELIRWFWRSCFSRRYSAGVNDVHKTDIRAMEELRNNENVSISSFKCEIGTEFFINNKFNLTAANTKMFIVLLASNKPRSFISGANVDLDNYLKNASKREFHHIFPVKFLTRQHYSRDKIYILANFCFLNNADNQKIKDKGPKIYKELLNQESIEDIMKSALCPVNSLDLDYDKFIDDRVEILIKYANKLIA